MKIRNNYLITDRSKPDLIVLHKVDMKLRFEVLSNIAWKTHSTINVSILSLYSYWAKNVIQKQKW